MAINSKETITTTGQLRVALAETLLMIKEGKLSGTDAKGIIGTANQITNSIATELKYQNLQNQLGQKKSVLGALNIGGDI